MRRLIGAVLLLLLAAAVVFIAFGGRIYADVDVVGPRFNVDKGSLPGVDATVRPGDLPDISVDPATPR